MDVFFDSTWSCLLGKTFCCCPLPIVVECTCLKSITISPNLKSDGLWGSVVWHKSVCCRAMSKNDLVGYSLGQSFMVKTSHWLRQISMKLPAILRNPALKFTKGSKRENSLSYYFLLSGFHQNSISNIKYLAIMLEWDDFLINR